LASIRHEIEILGILDHPNIIKYYESYEDDKCFYIVMEYCPKGDLLDMMLRREQEKGRFTEEEVANLIETLIRAIIHCH